MEVTMTLSVQKSGIQYEAEMIVKQYLQYAEKVKKKTHFKSFLRMFILIFM